MLIGSRLSHELREASDLKSKALGGQKLGIVRFGVHPQDDQIKLACNTARMPSEIRGEQACPFEPRARWVKNDVVRASNVMPLRLKVKRKSMHDGATDGD